MAAQLYRAFLLYVLGGVVLVAGLAYRAGRSRTNEPSENPRIAPLLEVIRTTRAKMDLSAIVADSLRRVANRRGERQPGSSEGAFTITPITIKTTMPTPGATPAISADTTELMLVHRVTPPGAWPVPKFFVDAYHAERNLRLWHERYTIPYKDTLLAQTDSLSREYAADAQKWKRLANPKCGTRCKLVIGATLGEGARRLVGSWLHGQ